MIVAEIIAAEGRNIRNVQDTSGVRPLVFRRRLPRLRLNPQVAAVDDALKLPAGQAEPGFPFAAAYSVGGTHQHTAEIEDDGLDHLGIYLQSRSTTLRSWPRLLSRSPTAGRRAFAVRPGAVRRRY